MCSSGRCWGGAVRDRTPHLPPPVSFHTHCCSSLWSRWRPSPSASLLWRAYCNSKTTIGEHKNKTLTNWSRDVLNNDTKLNSHQWRTYFIVRVIPAHRNGVHYIFAPLILSGRAIRNIIWIVNSTEVVAKLMGGNQVRFLLVYGQKINLLNKSDKNICLDSTCLGKNGFSIIFGAGQSSVEVYSTIVISWRRTLLRKT